MPSISALRIAARFAPLPHAAAFEAKKPILKPFKATLPWDEMGCETVEQGGAFRHVARPAFQRTIARP